MNKAGHPAKHNGIPPHPRRNGQFRDAPARNRHAEDPVLITGGAGFIGTNLAHRLATANRPVILFDNLSRPGVEQNLAWLKATHGPLIRHEPGDVRDLAALRQAVRQASAVFHLAAQVAVTTSLDHPVEDFEVNARGTLNLLEALRALPQPPPLVFTSTNKVYGDLRELKLLIKDGRYEPQDDAVRAHGFGESCPLHFHSPYGCSKGAAGQYVQDYARTFGLPTVVFRMSCIYGPHQFGTEDQGWVAHFLIRALENSPLTIYGDGRQVRDVLFADDLVEAFLLAQEHVDRLAGEAFNIGGGPANTTSLLELMDIISELNGHCPAVRFADWRPADQLYYVSDTRKFSRLTGWAPSVGLRQGVKALYEWLREFRRQDAPRLVRLRSLRPRADGGLKRISTRAIRPRIPAAGKIIKLKSFCAAGNGGTKKTEQKLVRAN